MGLGLNAAVIAVVVVVSSQVENCFWFQFHLWDFLDGWMDLQCY